LSTPGERPFELSHIRRYLEGRTDKSVKIQHARELGGEAKGAAALKRFGYGRPLLITYRADGQEQREVLHRIRRNAFGRERDADRVAAVWLDYNTFNHLPRHVPALDLVELTQEGAIRSLGAARELLLVTGYRSGNVYADDLLRIRDEGEMDSQDVERAEALAAYLAGIHVVKREEPVLWRRRLRDLVGHGEGIMGLTDSYPPDLQWTSGAELRSIEEAANRWRWQLKSLTHRLSQVHGDFHPFNVLFDQGSGFVVLDRSRGEWGEPADDVSCMTINYLFFSLQRSGHLEGPFLELHDRFWRRYLALQHDQELLSVIQPWFAWRALVVASPVWYPSISEPVRRKLLDFAHQVMATPQYDFEDVNQYLEGS
jgi:hypothetical protein